MTKKSVYRNNRNKRHTLAALIIISMYIAHPVISDETPESEDDVSEELVSQRQDWQETLAFGIDSKVIELISTLKERRETSMHADLIERFQLSNNPALKREVFDFFREMKYPGLEDEALDILTYFYEFSNTLIRSATQYIGAIEVQAADEAADLLRDLILEENTTYSNTAVNTLAQIARDDDVLFFIDILKDQNIISQSIRESILLAFGTIRNKLAVEYLIELLEDDAESATVRQYAADSLGKIGDQSAIPSLIATLDSEDNLLRAYAISALGNFPEYDNSAILQQALRDSYWRTREVAIDGIENARITTAVPALRYMARQDPEARIRRKAVSTLATLDTPEAWDFILTEADRSTTAFDMRTHMLNLIIDKNPGAGTDLLKKIMQEEWEKENSRLLDAICRKMSTRDNPELEQFYVKMLEHSNFIIQMYGVRGIGRNALASQIERIESFTASHHPAALRREAASSLEQLR
ncbi:HEAT repeat domain-containing protein [Spirochaeta dissipatitropha]